MSEHWKFETRSVHSGYQPDPTTKSVAVPIYQTDLQSRSTKILS